MAKRPLSARPPGDAALPPLTEPSTATDSPAAATAVAAAPARQVLGKAIAGVVSLDRRTGRDRRTGVDRRNCAIPVEGDRRAGKDRRTGFDRRAKGLEPLEGRRMFSAVSMEDGILVVRGSVTTANELSVSLHGDRLVGQANDATLSVNASKVRSIRIIGGEQADRVTVDDSVTVNVNVQTGNGNDTIATAGGDDLVLSGNGNDWVETGAGHDSIRTGNGRDTVIAGAGDDQISGGNGSDSLLAGKGDDRVDAGSGDDKVYAGDGDDRVDAGPGRDVLRGGEGNDTVQGKSGDDLKGNGGADVVSRAPANTETPASLPSNFTFTLINADTDRPIPGYESLRAGARLDLSKLPTRNLNVRANLPQGFGGSVVFRLNGRTIATEGFAPYSLGDTGADYRPVRLNAGAHKLTAVAYSDTGGKGQAGRAVEVDFTIVDPAPNPNPNSGGNTGGNNGGNAGGNTGGTGNNGAGGNAGGSNSGTGNNSGSTGNVGNTGGGPVLGNENPNPSAPAPVARLDAMHTRIEAGHAIHVDATKSSISSGSSLSARFEWDFGDPGSRFNKLVGFNAAHVYRQPGTYTITLRVTDNAGRTSIDTQTVTVAASTRKVFYVAANGDDANDGLSPASPIRSLARVGQLVADNTEFRFRAGDTFTQTRDVVVRSSNVVITSYGNGDKPTLRWTGGSGVYRMFDIMRNSTHFTASNLTFDSQFTDFRVKSGVPNAFRPGGTNFTAVGCEILNINYFVNSELKPTGVLVQDCVAPTMTGLRSYLSYVVGNDHVYLGNTVANATREHCIRVDGGFRVLIAHNDFQNVAEGQPGDKTDIMKQTITVHWGADMYLYANRTRGGRVEIGPLGAADGLKPNNFNQRLTRVVIDSNRFDFGQYQRVEIDHGTSGVMFRANQLNVPSGAGISIESMASYTSYPQYGNRNVSNVWVTNDNEINATNRVAIGRGSANINIAPARPAAARAA